MLSYGRGFYLLRSAAAPRTVGLDKLFCAEDASRGALGGPLVTISCLRAAATVAAAASHVASAAARRLKPAKPGQSPNRCPKSSCSIYCDGIINNWKPSGSYFFGSPWGVARIACAAASPGRRYSSSSNNGDHGSCNSSAGGSHYKTLGVNPNATQAEIRQAYVSKALKLHPDRNKNDPDAATRFHELRVAYDVLSRPFSRSQYDRQIDGARGFGDVQDAAAAAWGKETEEQRTLRQQRYRRYAEGTRGDVPYDDTPGVLPVIICSFLAISYFSVAHPKHRETEQFHDEVTARDRRGDPLVKAFFNPLSSQWERLPPGYDPPLPLTLHKMYSIRYPALRLDRSHVPNQLAVSKLPLSETEPSRLVRDPLTGQHVWTAELRETRLPSSSSNSSDCGSGNGSSGSDAAQPAAPRVAKAMGAAALCS